MKFVYKHIKLIMYTILCLGIVSCGGAANEQIIKIGSKKFTESVILGEIIKGMLNENDITAVHEQQLGGTRILWNGLLNGDLDIYPEYTGTIEQEILAGENISSEQGLVDELDKYGIGIAAVLGFNNTYALGMMKDRAVELGISKISDLNNYPELRVAFTNEFMDRADGYPSLKNSYSLIHENVRGVDHDIAYRGLAEGSVDVIDLYTTDAEINYYDIKILEDDKGFFKEYNAVVLYRKKILEVYPRIESILGNLENKISEKVMIAMNGKVKISGESEVSVASNFLNDMFGYDIDRKRVTWLERLVSNTLDHLFLVGISLLAAILLSIPIGIYSFYNQQVGVLLISATGIIQTIPSLALLVFMIPFFGIGAVPAIVALFLYSLLPIVRNTYLGLNEIPTPLRESAEVLGLSSRKIFTKIYLPIASPSIITGIKTAAVINVGTATLGALIGAGGYGQPILTGIRLDDISLILEGAIPAALLALLVQGFFDIIEKTIVPAGIKYSNAG